MSRPRHASASTVASAGSPQVVRSPASRIRSASTDAKAAATCSLVPSDAWMSPAAATRITLPLLPGRPGYDPGVSAKEPPLNGMVPTLKRSAAALRDAGVPFLVAGGVASWVRGGPDTDHDLDFVVKPADADRALAALEEAGLRPEKPPEEWLYKAFDGDIMVDLIFSPAGLEITDEVIERGEEREVEAMTMRVMTSEDLLVSKRMAMTEHTINYRSCLEIARALREQIDFEDVRERTRDLPFGRDFFVIAEGLEIV